MTPIKIKGWMAFDKDKTEFEYKNNFFIELPVEYKTGKGERIFSGRMENINQLVKLKRGEVKKVEITIKEIK